MCHTIRTRFSRDTTLLFTYITACDFVPTLRPKPRYWLSHDNGGCRTSTCAEVILSRKTTVAQPLSALKHKGPRSKILCIYFLYSSISNQKRNIFRKTCISFLDMLSIVHERTTREILFLRIYDGPLRVRCNCVVHETVDSLQGVGCFQFTVFFPSLVLCKGGHEHVQNRS